MTIDAGVVRGYLLQTLGDERSTTLEQALLADRELLTTFEEVERDLVDDYVGQRLSRMDSARFERHYLVGPHHEARLVVAEALRRQRPTATASSASALARWWPWAAVFAVATGGWALTAWPRDTVDVLRTAAAPLMSPLPSPRPDRAGVERPSLRVAIALPATTMRSGAAATPRARLTPDVAFVDLLIEGAPGLANAAVNVRSTDERLVWSGRALPAPASADAVLVRVPADRLTPDDYIVTVFGSGGGAVTRRFFRVVHD